MDTYELQYLLDHSPLLSSLHGQVCAKDMLPEDKPHHMNAYIVNTHNANQPGEHWVAIFFKDNKAVYFDSYGLPPLPDMASFMDKHAKTISWNSHRVQGTAWPVCGLYCVFALDYLARGCDLNQILKIRFRDSYARNDHQVLGWSRQNYAIYYQQAPKVMKTGQKCRCEVPSLSVPSELLLQRLFSNIGNTFTMYSLEHYA